MLSPSQWTTILNLPWFGPLLKKVSELIYTATHIQEIEARDQLEASWKVKEQHYGEELATLQTQLNNLSIERSALMNQATSLQVTIIDRDKQISQLSNNLKAITLKNQELMNAIAIKEDDVSKQSTSDALHSDI
jgi:chromosome segregation ATPase